MPQPWPRVCWRRICPEGAPAALWVKPSSCSQPRAVPTAADICSFGHKEATQRKQSLSLVCCRPWPEPRVLLSFGSCSPPCLGTAVADMEPISSSLAVSSSQSRDRAAGGTLRLQRRTTSPTANPRHSSRSGASARRGSQRSWQFLGARAVFRAPPAPWAQPGLLLVPRVLRVTLPTAAPAAQEPPLSPRIPTALPALTAASPSQGHLSLPSTIWGSPHTQILLQLLWRGTLRHHCINGCL